MDCFRECAQCWLSAVDCYAHLYLVTAAEAKQLWYDWLSVTSLRVVDDQTATCGELMFSIFNFIFAIFQNNAKCLQTQALVELVERFVDGSSMRNRASVRRFVGVSVARRRMSSGREACANDTAKRLVLAMVSRTF